MGTSDIEGERMLKIQGKEELLQGIYYEIPIDVPPLGAGGHGTVRAGYQVNEKTGERREVAVKFLFDDLPDGAILRSEREANIRIKHENLVEMIAFVKVGEDDDLYGRTTVRYHVVSELLRGVMLLDLIERKVEENDLVKNPVIKEYYDLYNLNRNQFAIKIVRHLLSGIMALHQYGFIHRDIDPSNIMITTDGKVKLIDLGIAKQIGSVSGKLVTSDGQFIGKAPYAAPELVIGDTAHQNETTDIYAIGIVLFQLVTGTMPFSGTTYEVLEMQKNMPMPLYKVVDRKLRAIIKKATAKKQSERYRTAALFRDDLDKLVNTLNSKGNIDYRFSVGSIPFLVTVVLGLLTGIILAIKFI